MTNVNVMLPDDFVMTKFPGYFWNVRTERLYTIKSTGCLKMLKENTYWVIKQYGFEPGYRVSVKGIRRHLTLRYLKTLTPAPNQVIPVIG